MVDFLFGLHGVFRAQLCAQSFHQEPWRKMGVNTLPDEVLSGKLKNERKGPNTSPGIVLMKTYLFRTLD